MSGKGSVVHELDAAAIDALVARAQDCDASKRPIQEVGTKEFELPALTADFKRIHQELMHGRGFVVVRGLPVKNFSTATLEAMYWGLGLQLGTPVSQSVMGDMIGFVTDVTDHEKNVRPYRARNSLRLHTDFADFSALFCIRTAKTGGESSVVSTLAIHDEMLQRAPDSLELLYRGFHFHRLGEHAAAESAITAHRVPVFSETEGHVSCRYSRAYIMEAEAASGEPLSEQERQALDLFDEIAYREDMRTSFMLAPGEVLFMNSHTTLHTRSAFEDWKPPAAKRLLLRLWLAAHQPRPLAPEMTIYGTDPNGIPVRGSGEPAGFERVASADYLS